MYGRKGEISKVKQVFRKEIKYVILKSEFYRIRKHLDVLMKKDKHCDIDGYMVRSLYFDSLYNRDLYDTLDGNMEKQKIRLRIYSIQPSSLKRIVESLDRLPTASSKYAQARFIMNLFRR